MLKQEKQELGSFSSVFNSSLRTFLAMAKPSHSVTYRKVDVDAIETYNPDDDPTLVDDGVTGPNEGEVTGLLTQYPLYLYTQLSVPLVVGLFLMSLADGGRDRVSTMLEVTM